MKINKKKILFFLLAFFIIVFVYFKYRSCNCYLYMGMSKNEANNYCTDTYLEEGECPNSCHLEGGGSVLESGTYFHGVGCYPNCENNIDKS